VILVIKSNVAVYCGIQYWDLMHRSQELQPNQCNCDTLCITVAIVLVFVRLSNWTFDGELVKDWITNSAISLDDAFDTSSVS